MYIADGKAKWNDIPQCSRQSLYKQIVPAVIVAVQGQIEYESTWKLLG